MSDYENNSESKSENKSENKNDSYERVINEKLKSGEALPPRLNYPTLKFFWQAGPLSRKNKDAIPSFLRNVEIFKNFTENELRILSKYMHLRAFEKNEIIFRQGDRGFGFYLVLSGEVGIYLEEEDFSNEVKISNPNAEFIPDSKKDNNNSSSSNSNKDNQNRRNNDHRYRLSRLLNFDHFGELALLQANNLRTATAEAETSCALLGIFRPDLEELIEGDAVVGNKLLQSISMILINRLSLVGDEMRYLRRRVYELEQLLNISHK
ncbi:MAG: cyclic nucleotide-binding domain-containing protein [Oligoflexia bacterium]|nr:cyclic nucleotide-binding domain-containing protein [Oligoflexia bacterium]